MHERNPQAATTSGVARSTPLRRAAALPALLAALLVAATLASIPGAAAQTGPPSFTFPIAAEAIDSVRWSDTWGAPRSGGRSHIGVDILGDKMIPLVAAADAQVTWGRFSNSRGSIVRLRDDAGWEYQYIHLNNDRPGTDDGAASCEQALSAKLCASRDGSRLRRGVRVEAGEVIGYMGDSGNAEWTTPHLHFEIYRPGETEAMAVNPTSLVDAAAARIRNGGGGEHGAVIERIHKRLHGRSPSTAERSALQAVAGDRGTAGLLTEAVVTDPAAAAIDRLYLAFFLRYPDGGGWDYWVDVHADGHDLERIAEWFAQSAEFERRYGSTTFSEFLDQLYADVLGRAPDAEGKAYWLDRLAEGDVTRGTIVVSFTEGEELRTVARWRTELTIVHRALDLDRPTDAEVVAWSELRRSAELEAAIAGLLPSGG